MIYRPDTSWGLDCYIDADFSGGWKDGDHDSPESVLSRKCFVIMYSGCPIHWGRKIQQKFSLLLLKASTFICQTQRENWLYLWVLWKKLQVYFDYWQDIQYFVALSGKIFKAVSLLQRSHSLLLKQSILPSSIISFDVFLVMEQLSWTKLITQNRLHIFSQSSLEKRASANCGISLWGNNCFWDTTLIYYYYSFRGSVRI